MKMPTFEKTKYDVEFSHKFKKGFKKLVFDEKVLVAKLMWRLANGEVLEARFKDHALRGEFTGLRECHVRPDLLLVYERRDDVLVLVCVSVGSHAEIFG